MNVFVLLVGLLFLAAGTFLAVTGRSPAAGWAGISFGAGCAAIAAWDLFDTHFRRPRARARCLAGRGGAGPLVIRSSRVHALVYRLGAAGFTEAGFLMVESGQHVVIGWLTVAFFGLGCLVFLWQVVDPRPRLVLDEEGVFDRTLGVGPIAWSDIKGWYVRSIQGNDFVCLLVRNPAVYLGKLSRVRRALRRANRALGFTDLYLNLGGLALTTEEILAAITLHIEDPRRAEGQAGEGLTAGV